MRKNLQLVTELKQADVIIAKKRTGLGRILDHYIVYLGNDTFIGNLKEGVKLIPQHELLELLKEYEPIKITPLKERIMNVYRQLKGLNQSLIRDIAC